MGVQAINTHKAEVIGVPGQPQEDVCKLQAAPMQPEREGGIVAKCQNKFFQEEYFIKTLKISGYNLPLKLTKPHT